MIEKNDIKLSLLKALYTIVACYIALNMLGALVCILTDNSWEHPDNARLTGGILLLYSMIINFITALIAKRFNRIIFCIHGALAIICLAPLIILNGTIVQTDSEETAVFEEHRDSFDLVNSYVLENFGHLENDYILVNQDDNGDINSIYNDGQNIKLTEELKFAFNDIADAICYSFSGINIEKYRITYCYVNTFKRYVYSRNGETPNYFHYEGDEMPITVYKLPDNWFLLDSWSR